MMTVVPLVVCCLLIGMCSGRDLTVIDLARCLSGCLPLDSRCKHGCHNQMKPVFAPCRDECLQHWFNCKHSCDKNGSDSFMSECLHICTFNLGVCVTKCP